MRIVYEGADGILKIVAPVVKEQIEGILGPLTDEAYMTHVLERSVPTGTPHHILDEAAIPSARDFRNAWTLQGKGISIDMPKARDIHREKLRALRAPLLAALDIDAIRAVRDPKALDAIEAKKQALRDATADPTIDAAKSPEELLAVMPASLRG